MRYRFTIHGAPRTKNRSRPVQAKEGIRLIPSKPYVRWFRSALRQLPLVRVESGLRGRITERVNVTAIFYRDRDQGDEDNFKKGLGDFLQKANLIKNDKQLHWTGETRLAVDRERPRIEVMLEIEAPQPQ